jgi:hypothetical protein
MNCRQRRGALLQEFKPENELENAIADAREGARAVADLMRIIARSNLFISSKGEVQSDWGGFDPLLFEKDGHPFVAIFSSLSRPGLHGHMAEYLLQNERAGVFSEDAGRLRRYSQVMSHNSSSLQPALPSSGRI